MKNICLSQGTRLTKVALLMSVALYFLIVVFNNLTDYQSNFNFVSHVLSMDTTFPNNQGLWRKLTLPLSHHAFYASLILWEAVICFLSFKAGLNLYRAIHDSVAFSLAKQKANMALVMGLLLWFVAFTSIGGEWFLMWQSEVWNGQETAARMFTVLGIILIYVNQQD